MFRASARRLTIGDVTLNVAQAGAGAPVLLLHGFPDSLRLWESVAPRIAAAGYRVIAPDLRGFGDSDAPAGRRHYGIDRLLGDLTGLLRTLEVPGPVHVVGHDWGAVLAWCLAMSQPGQVRSCVAISVGHPREYALAGLEQKRKGLYTIGWQFRGLAERWLVRDDCAPLRRWLRQHPDADGCVRELGRPGRLTAGLNWYRANLLPVLFRPWPRCRVPTLGIWSSADHCLAEDQMLHSGRRMAAPWRYERLEGIGHWVPLERPDRVAALAVDWFGAC
jgi:pimeloyl-ACP methyl ester carboxylesterase